MPTTLRLSAAMVQYMIDGGAEQATSFSDATIEAEAHLKAEHDIDSAVLAQELSELLRTQAERTVCPTISLIHLANHAELAAMAIIGQIGTEDADAVQGLWECFTASVAYHLGIRLHEEHLKAAGELTPGLVAEPTPTRH